MNDRPEMPKRSVNLPLGCKDLFDVDEIRNWKPAPYREWPKSQTSDRLAYIEGQLAELLQSEGKSKVVSVSRHEDHGQIMVIADSDLDASVLFASWHGTAQEQTLRRLFEEAGARPAVEPVGRWKSKRSFKYQLPAEPSMAARFIGEVLRDGYGFGDLSVINLSYHEPTTA